MGTRAVINYGSTWIATHWDGNPKALGQDLKSAINRKGSKRGNIINTAYEYTIDVLADSKSKFNRRYKDWAEYEYKIKGNKVVYRELSGAWGSVGQEKGKWERL